MSRTPTITLSFDDGCPDDFRALDMLLARNLKATFYVTFNDPGRPEISVDEMRRLSEAGMEIASHTLSHKMLVLQSPAQVRRELSESKARLEDITGAPVTALSYPLGYLNADILRAMAETGYKVGRTQVLFRTGPVKDLLRMPITVDATPRPAFETAKHAVRDMNAAGLAAWTGLGLATDPEAQLPPLLAATRRNGGVFHLYARSWELRQQNRWDAFERMLDRISGLPGVAYRTNSAAALGG